MATDTRTGMRTSAAVKAASAALATIAAGCFAAAAFELGRHDAADPTTGLPATGSAAPGGNPASRGPAGATGPAIVREIRVVVACDEDVRAHPGWRERATTLVRLASVPWEREFGVRWTPVRCVEWTTDDTSAELQDLRKHLAKTVSFGTEEVALGLTAQDRPSGATDRYAALGVSDYFGRVAVAGVDWPGCWGRDPNTVAHEFGHLFGAWHCTESDTVMTAPSSDLTRFDAQTRKLIPIVRGFDFRGGTDSLGDVTVDSISELWMAGHAPDAQHPVAQALVEKGWDRVLGSEPERAERDFERAIRVLASCGVTRGQGVSSCFVGIARSYAFRSPADPVRELEFARRARATADGDEDPIASSWMQLGHALWANGLHEESIDAYIEALRQRRTRLGASHGLTGEARQSLQWFAERGRTRAAEELKRETEPAATGGAKPR